MSTDAGKRRHKRYVVSYPVCVTRSGIAMDPSAKTAFAATIVDISQSGARLELREFIQPKEELRIVVSGESIGLGLDVTALVRWCVKVTGGYVAGVEFTEVRKFSPAGSPQTPSRARQDSNAS